MCTDIIIDTNQIPNLLNTTNASDKLLHEYIQKKHLTVLYSNDQSFEKDNQNEGWKRKLSILKRVGKARMVTDGLSKVMEEIHAENKIKSNDIHILALSLYSKTSPCLLHSLDKALIADFKNLSTQRNSIERKVYPSALSTCRKFLEKCKCTRIKCTRI